MFGQSSMDRKARNFMKCRNTLPTLLIFVRILMVPFTLLQIGLEIPLGRRTFLRRTRRWRRGQVFSLFGRRTPRCRLVDITFSAWLMEKNVRRLLISRLNIRRYSPLGSRRNVFRRSCRTVVVVLRDRLGRGMVLVIGRARRLRTRRW